MRLFNLILSLTLLVASPMTGHAKDYDALPDGYTRVDLVALQAQFYQQYPSTNVFGFVNKSNSGIKLNREGRMEWKRRGMTGGFRIRSWVNEYTAERACFRPYDNWIGACLELYRKGDSFICKSTVTGRDPEFWSCAPKAFPRLRW